MKAVYIFAWDQRAVLGLVLHFFEMRSQILITLVAWISTIGSSVLTPQDREWLVDFHHQHRSNVTPPAANMLFLVRSLS